MPLYVAPTEQLVVEVLVRNIAASREFYQKLGFAVVEDRHDFVVVAWEGHQLFLDERHDLPPPLALPQTNVRIMVPNVEAYWTRVREMGATIVQALGEREYGLKDFTVADLDGFGLRFASRLLGT